MKKTLIALLCVLVACISFVACNNELSNETEVSFTPSVSKALNQKAATNSSDLANVDDYYWQYYCSKTKPSTTFSDNSGFVSFYTETPTKGLGIIKNVKKNDSYYFGLRGYSDSAMTELVWEGYHYSNSADNTSTDTTSTTAQSSYTDFALVQLTSKTTLVTIDVFGMGQGYLEFNITAPYNFSDDIDDEDKMTVADFSTSYFKVEYQAIGSATTNTFYLGKDATNANTDYFAVGTEYRTWNSTKDPKEVAFDNSAADSSSKALTNGVYLFTISQVYTVSGEELQVTNRKQVMIVNIVTGAKTVISGSLDSTIGAEEFYYQANGWTSSNQQHMHVIFHVATASTIKTLTVTNASSDASYVTVVSGTPVTFTPSVLATSVKAWYLNGEILSTGANTTKYNSTVTVNADGSLQFSRIGTDVAYYILTCVVDGSSADDAQSYSFTVR